MLTTALEQSCASSLLPSLAIYSFLISFCLRYLIEGPNGAVLHTGDMRAETAFLAELRRNPFLRRYMPPDPSIDFRDTGGSSTETEAVFPALEAIYLDTACLMGTIDVPSKVSRIPQYPPQDRPDIFSRKTPSRDSSA